MECNPTQGSPEMHTVHGLSLACPWQSTAFWKGMPLKNDVRSVLCKVLQNQFRTAEVRPYPLPVVEQAA